MSLLIALSWLIMRDVVSVLRRLSSVAVQIQEGHTDLVVEHRSRDELGVLADAFRSMVPPMPWTARFRHAHASSGLPVKPSGLTRDGSSA